MSVVESRTFNRSEARRWLHDAITFCASSDVQVTRNEPRDLTDLCIWLGDTTGSVDYPALGRNLPRQDTFTTLVTCSAIIPGDDASEAEQRCETLASAVLDAVSGDPHVPVEVTGLIDVAVTAVDGPDVVPVVEGYAALMTVAVRFDVRITR